MQRLWLALALGVVCAAPAMAQNDIKVLATNKTSTLQKELADAGAAGYQFVGMTVSDTMMGGPEVVCILRRKSTT